MEIKTAMAGTLESGDIFIQIAPNDNAGLHIDLESTVAYQFGDQIKKVITETLQGLGIDQAEVHRDPAGPGHRPSRGESHGQGSPGLHHPRPRDGSRRSRYRQRRVGRLINTNKPSKTRKLLCNDSEEQ